MKNSDTSDINCEKILLREIASKKDSEREHDLGRDKINEENIESKNNEIEKDFDVIIKQVQTEMNNLDKLKNDLINFKNNKLKKNKKQINKPIHYENSFNFKNISPESSSELSQPQMPNEDSLDLENKLNQLKTLNALKEQIKNKKKQEEKTENDFSKIDLNSLQKYLSINNKNMSGHSDLSNSNYNFNTISKFSKAKNEENNNLENTENMLKDFLNKSQKAEPMSMNTMEETIKKFKKDNEAKKEQSLVKQSLEKQSIEKQQVEKQPVEKQPAVLGLSLSEIEKQIAMLKNLSIKN
jgi:hypothetical protein